MPIVVIHLGLLVVVACWGLVFVGIAELLPHIDSVQLVVIRFFMISAVFVGIFAARPELRPRPTRRQLGVMVVAGALSVPLSQLPIVQGQRYLSPPLVSLLVTTSPAWTAVMAAGWLRERFTKLQALGFVIALGGAAVVILAGSGEGDIVVDNPWGAALALVSPMAWALYTVMSKRMTSEYEPITAVGLAMITGTLTMLPLFPYAATGIDDIPSSGWWWMLFLALGGTTVPYLIWFNALRRLDASKTVAYMYAVPLAALLWSWLILDLVPATLGLVGGGVIIVGVAMTQFGARRRTPAATAAIPPEPLVG